MASGMATSKMIVRYRNETYDITEFMKKHPGGSNTLSGMIHTDIDFKFDTGMPHSPAAKYLMQEYKVSTITNDNVDETDASNANDARQSYNPNTSAMQFNNNINNNNNNNNNHHKQFDPKSNDDIPVYTDESMEHLLDWSRGMVSQIGQLGDKYAEWVNKPVDRPLRLFDNSALEMLTKTPWWLVPSIWIPLICFILHLGIQDAFSRNYSNSYVIFRILFGLFLWTLIEYTLHRWLFHIDSQHRGSAFCTFHFLLHGLHHKVPFDPFRLVFPPFPAAVLATIFYQPGYFLFECPKIVLAGCLMGYLIYDMIHYYIHHGSPSGGHFYYMKRYHYQHHFVHHDRGFGISSPIWDEAFGTKIILRKLRQLLKW